MALHPPLLCLALCGEKHSALSRQNVLLLYSLIAYQHAYTLTVSLRTGDITYTYIQSYKLICEGWSQEDGKVNKPHWSIMSYRNQDHFCVIFSSALLPWFSFFGLLKMSIGCDLFYMARALPSIPRRPFTLDICI